MKADAASRAKWDRRFMSLADHVAQWSKDPSTKVGACIAAPDRTIVSLGYNGFPRGVRDDALRYADRATKYEFVVHAEMNALLTAPRIPPGCTLYVNPLFPCPTCAAAIVQSGIARVVTHLATDRPDWAPRWALARTIMLEGGVSITVLPRDDEPGEAPADCCNNQDGGVQ